jgi:hypothetical protein
MEHFVSTLVGECGECLGGRHSGQERNPSALRYSASRSNLLTVAKVDALAGDELREAVLIARRIALDGSDVRKFLAFCLAVIEDRAPAKSQQQAFRRSVLAFGCFSRPNHGCQNEDAFFSLANVTPQFVPGMKASDMCSRRLLQRDEHYVVKAVAMEAAHRS